MGKHSADVLSLQVPQKSDPLGCEDFCHPAPVSEPSLQVRVTAFACTGPVSLRNLSVHMCPALHMMLFRICCCWHLSPLFFFVSSFLAPVWIGDLGSSCRYFQIHLLVFAENEAFVYVFHFLCCFWMGPRGKGGNAELMQPSSSCSFILSLPVPHSSSGAWLFAPVCLLFWIYSVPQLGLTVLSRFRTSYDKDLPSSGCFVTVLPFIFRYLITAWTHIEVYLQLIYFS